MAEVIFYSIIIGILGRRAVLLPEQPVCTTRRRFRRWARSVHWESSTHVTGDHHRALFIRTWIFLLIRCVYGGGWSAQPGCASQNRAETGARLSFC